MGAYIKSSYRIAFVAVLGLGATACDTQRPETVVWISGETVPAVDPEAKLGCDIDAVSDGQGISVRHTLPEQVETESPVQIRLDTPCTSAFTTMEHDIDGVAQTTAAAPPGASCSLSVTVEIANDRQICATDNSSSTACANLDELCAEIDGPVRDPPTEGE